MTSAASRHRGQWDRCRSGRGVRGLEHRISGASPRCGASSEATCICAGCCRIPAGRAACAPGQGHRSRQLGADPRRGHPQRHHRILNDPSRKNAVAFERRHQLSGIAKCGSVAPCERKNPAQRLVSARERIRGHRHPICVSQLCSAMRRQNLDKTRRSRLHVRRGSNAAIPGRRQHRIKCSRPPNSGNR